MSDESSASAEERGHVSAVPEPGMDRAAAEGENGGSKDAEAEQGVHSAATCPVAWCPFCLAIGAVQPLKPDVVDHLLKAGTELLLAFRDVLDARAQEVDEGSSSASSSSSSTSRLEKIDLG
jgi:hypothetical protein